MNEFNFVQLKDQERMIFKTQNSIYELKLMQNKRALIVGGNLPNQSLRFSEPTNINLLGAVNFDGYILNQNCIISGMRFGFAIEETQQIIFTSEVEQLEIYSENINWKYVNEWKKAESIVE